MCVTEMFFIYSVFMRNVTFSVSLNVFCFFSRFVFGEIVFFFFVFIHRAETVFINRN